MIFDAVLVEPLLRRHVISLKGEKDWVTWVYLAFAVVSGGIWLLLQASSMSGTPLNEVLTSGVLSIVVNETQFGQVTTVRAGLVVCLAVCLVFRRAVVAHWLGLAAAVAFAGSLAWTGHAGATAGLIGYVHLAADVLHVLATAAWIGGIAALIKFLSTSKFLDNMSLGCDVVDRFSMLGTVCVATLIFTGLINATVLVGSLQGLLVTEYGRVLVVKIAIFALMLAFAATNRFYLRPQLASNKSASQVVARHYLIKSCAIELALGFGVLLIVGILGTLHPAIHSVIP